MLVARVAARGLERALSALACAALLGLGAVWRAVAVQYRSETLRKQLNDSRW